MRNGNCWVYLMQCGKFIKVGIAMDVARRLSGVDGGPFEVRLIAKRRLTNRAAALCAEKEIHKKLKRYHHRKEWFIIKPDNALKLLSRESAKARLADYLETSRPLTGTITVREMFQPALPRHMKGENALEQWKWRRVRKKAYQAAIERNELTVA